MKPQGFVPVSSSPSAHEAADLHVRKVVGMAALLFVTLVASILGLLLVFHFMNGEYPGRTSEAAPVVTAADLPPAPRLQTDPLRDLQAMRAVEDSHLNQYRWLDQAHEVAQIPIERAEVLLVKNEAAAPATNVPSANVVLPAANVAPTPATTELQMRQQKAQEVLHAP